MERLLIVEDDIIICGGIKAFLEGKGYEAECAYTLSEAREALKKPYHLIILDCNLPDGDGMELCLEIRQKQNIPVIFLTANDTEEDMIRGFQAGCDDYIAKPFSVEVLYQRVMAVLRRSHEEPDGEIFRYRDLSIDFEKMQVCIQEQPIKLSATEYRLVELLVRNRKQVLTRSLILERIWDYEGDFLDENTLNVYIRRLRQKIETDAKDPQYIITVFGIGYTFGMDS
ncbi:MAG: response regulator transcription factor [Lachnospiraceae bacterium]|nr:response regulator transcription factor [Lachnospiraceae bacterium]